MKNRIFINLLLIEIFIIGVCIRIIYSQMHVSESVLNQMVSRKLYMVFIIPFASLKAQTSHERASCATLLFGL